jgi:photosystem II stability/assembly factor-like uncharacterized protein
MITDTSIISMKKLHIINEMMKKATCFSLKLHLTFLPLILFIMIGCKPSEMPEFSSEMINNIPWRNIGPGKYGGRISDIEVVQKDLLTIYISASTGGVFKSVDTCRSWIPIFDHVGTSLSVGDMAVSKSDPNIIWVGTGEASGEQSSASIGDGVYKSPDGGETWEHMGLEKSRHISRIRVHPENSDVVYVAATGSRWGANEDRGIYRSIDGGKNWEKILYVDENTGFSDLLLFPDGETLLASAWQQYRNAWAHVQRGPNSGLYRSTDGGDSWIKIEEVIPQDTIGRIALDYAVSDPDRVYACLEFDKPSFFRSDDMGETWTAMTENARTAYWYGRIYVDPTNKDRVWVMGTLVQETLDGGTTFNRIRMREVHVDHHVVWINPKDTSQIILGNDGGLYMTHDSGEKWEFIDNLPIGQYYNISVDHRDPYWIYGGLQDNGVWGAPSKSYSNKLISNSDYIHVAGGDGFYSATEPLDANTVYGESQYGYIVKNNLKKDERKMIRPQPETVEEEYRFTWNTPFFISRHKPHALYIGGNKLFKTEDRGENWKVISDDLTRGPKPDTITIMGVKPVWKPYAALTVLSESPLQQGVVYAGTDDGNLHLTRDDGETWTELTEKLPGPQNRFLTRIVTSIHDVATVYVAYGRYYEADDFSPYLYKSDDFGETWTKITGDMPEMAVIKGFAEHPRNPDLLFVGIHNGLLITVDGGSHWIQPENLLKVAIDDIEIAELDNDLVLGSYGRGIFIWDDIAMLEELTETVLEHDIYLFTPRETVMLEQKEPEEETETYDFKAPNPPEGVLITYYLKNGEPRSAKLQAKIRIEDSEGRMVKEINGTNHKGFNRIIWSVKEAGPGTYTITLIANRMEFSRKVSVKPTAFRRNYWH